MTSEFEAAIARFEDQWRSGTRPAIALHLREAGANLADSSRRILAIELVKVDLEYRWRAAQASGRRTALRLEAYAGRLALLGPVSKLPLDLIAEEYRVRHRFGDAPEIEEYVARFSHPRSALTTALEAVDRDLAAEGLATAARATRVARVAHHEVDPQAPLYFGDYVLQRQIGSGGICRVYGGLQLSLGKGVAIKVLRRRFWRSPEAVGHFVREAQFVAQLPPEGIVGIHGLGRLPQGGYFMVMDLIDGLDLRSRRDAGEVPLEKVKKWVTDAAAIIGRVHSSGFVHGDLKPANILVEHSGRVLITDFGFACPLTAEAFQPSGRIFGGTPAFLPPELIRVSDPPPHPATDVFGLGGVLFWLLTGRPVHEEPMTASRLAALSSSDWEASLAERLPISIPPRLSEVCRSCLALAPSARPMTGELIEELGGCD